MKTKNKLLIGAAVAGVLGMGVLTTSTTRVKPGYVGVVYSLNGGIQGDVLTQGMHFINPFHKVTQYSVATEQGYLSKDSKEGSGGNDSFTIPTADGKTVQVSLEYSYHFDVDKLPETFNRFKGQSGKTIEETFMRGKLKTYTGEVSSKFSVIDIYGDKRTDLNAAVLEYTRSKFEEYGIIIDSINVTEIEIDETTAAAIQNKINKQQEVEVAKQEAEKQAVENEKKIALAKAEAEEKRIKAEAEAESILIKAQAEAEANRLLSESLTDKLLQQQEIEKWDGSKATIISGGSTIVDTTKEE